MKHEEICPVCNSNEYVSINAGSYNSFVAHIKGSVDVVCCTNCGMLRVTQESLYFRRLKSIQEEKG